MLTLVDLKQLLREVNKSSNNSNCHRVIFYSDGSGIIESDDDLVIARFRDIAKLQFKNTRDPLSDIEGFND